MYPENITGARAKRYKSKYLAKIVAALGFIFHDLCPLAFQFAVT
jgi:hypothetical protein